jgi:type VI secretion system protein ImpC
MRQSTQHLLDIVRPPRVQITYDVEIGGAVESRELPYVLGVLADLSGMSKIPKAELKDRKFVHLSSDNFTDIMASISPRIVTKVKDCIKGDNHVLDIDLTFKSLDDFEPLNIIAVVPSLNELFIARTRLKDLLAKLSGNDDLNKVLDGLLAGDQASIDDVIQQGKMIKEASQTDYAKALINEFLKNGNNEKGAVPKDSIAAINQAIAKLDTLIGAQLDEILHDPAFLRLEGCWRGLWMLVSNLDENAKLMIRLLNISKDELRFDLEKAIEFDQSRLFKKIYEEEYGTFGGAPYSCLVADCEFGRGQADIALLTKLAQVAAAAHAPLIAGAHPSLFDLDSFVNLGVPRDLSLIFENTELGKWQSFRESEDARYVALTLPHMLMRAPYGPDTNPVNGLNYTEIVDGMDNSKFCWGNAAWALAQRIMNSAALYGWPAAIRGVEGGGLVEDLPYYTFKTTDGDVALKCPVEVAISDRREKELSDLGFIALCHCKNRDYAAFFGTQTVQKPIHYNLPEANANAALSARLSYILAASRFAHYIKVIMRDKVGSFMSKGEVERYLNNWISQYVLLADVADPASKARFPLREARIDVVDIPGKPGSYKATVFLRPHYQLEELTASIRLVANLPKPAFR